MGFTGAFCLIVAGGLSKALKKEQKMSLQPPLEGLSDYHISDRTRMILALAKFREEWQELVSGGSLMKIESPVGLLLADIADKLDLTEQERHIFLGGRLINEVDSFMETRVTRKMPL